MQADKNKTPEENTFRPADYGNASNPSPQPNTPTGENQLLDKGAEKYIREVANIEDVPDAQDQQDMDNLLEQEDDRAK